MPLGMPYGIDPDKSGLRKLKFTSDISAERSEAVPTCRNSRIYQPKVDNHYLLNHCW